MLPNPGSITKDGMEAILKGLVEALAQERTRQTAMPGAVSGAESPNGVAPQGIIPLS